jgi:hypothetical protein
LAFARGFWRRALSGISDLSVSIVREQVEDKCGPARCMFSRAGNHPDAIYPP